jgi:hypothetical protein
VGPLAVRALEVEHAIDATAVSARTERKRMRAVCHAGPASRFRHRRQALSSGTVPKTAWCSAAEARAPDLTSTGGWPLLSE